MRSLVWQAVDVLGPAPNAEDLRNLMSALGAVAVQRSLARVTSSAAFRAAHGPARICMLIAEAVPYTDGHEPAHIIALLTSTTPRGASWHD